MQAKLDAVKVQFEDNRVYKEKLMAVIANCQKMKLFSAARKAMPFIRENLEKKMKEVKKEVKMADDFLKRATNKVVGRVDDVILVF